MGDFPADMLKVIQDMHLSLITKIVNLSFGNGCFADDLKLAEVSPILKKLKKSDDLDKESIGLSLFYLMSKRSVKESFRAKLMCSSKISCQTY